jgi:hypothetical protein
MESDVKMEETASTQSYHGQRRLSTDGESDGQVFVSYGVILSLPYRKLEEVRSTLKGLPEVRVVYQTVSSDRLLILKARSAMRIMRGDLEDLSEIMNRKMKEEGKSKVGK